MADVDAELVGRWLEEFRTFSAGPPYLRIELTEQELIAVARGRTALLQALGLPGSLAPAGVSDTASTAATARPAPPSTSGSLRSSGATLGAYLTSFAAGLAEARAATDQPPGRAGPLELVAGLITGAAALGGPGRPGGAVELGTPLPGPNPAESAHRAGLAAAETVVTGADVREVTRAALLAGQQGWSVLPPASGPQNPDHRTHLLLTRLLHALHAATAPPMTGPGRAGCGAAAGENLGRAFAAEITFAVFGPDTVRSELQAELGELTDEVVVWSDGDRHRFHLHSDRPGEAIARAYGSATLFDLVVTARD